METSQTRHFSANLGETPGITPTWVRNGAAGANGTPCPARVVPLAGNRWPCTICWNLQLVGVLHVVPGVVA